jgi:hypothetical protein
VVAAEGELVGQTVLVVMAGMDFRQPHRGNQPVVAAAATVVELMVVMPLLLPEVQAETTHQG